MLRSIIRFAINFAIVLLLLQFATALAITFVISYVLWLLVDTYITNPGMRAADAVLSAKAQREHADAHYAQRTRNSVSGAA